MGNRPFAVQDARISRGLRKEPVPQTPFATALRARDDMLDPQTQAELLHEEQILSAETTAETLFRCVRVCAFSLPHSS